MDQKSTIAHDHVGEFAIAAQRQSLSLLRLSVPARVVIVGGIAALLWALVWLWALA